jgi:hypothetical protein
MRIVPRQLAVAIVVLAVSGAACAKSASPSSGGLSIVSPKDGSTVTGPVRLVLAAPGVQIGPPATGKMHFHVHVDGSSKYTIVYSTQPSLQIPNGRHTLKVVLARPNHDETSTSATVTITVSQSGASPSPTSSGYGY